MKNKKLLTTTALTTVLALTGVTSKLYAQSKSFSGPYISIGVTNQNSDTKITNDETPAAPTAQVYTSSVALDTAWVGFNSSATTIISRAANSLTKKNDNEFIGTASLGFMLPVDNNFLIGIQGSYIPSGGAKSYTNSYTQSTVANSGAGTNDGSSFTVSAATGTQSVKLTDKESWSISLLPSYAVNNDLMLFGKVGYVNFKQTANVSYSLDTASNIQKTNKLDGYVLGIGARYNLDKNLFLSFNFDASKFDKYTISQTDTATPSYNTTGPDTSVQRLSTTIDNDYMYNTTVSIGYKF